jgi:hypothetical protein
MISPAPGERPHSLDDPDVRAFLLLWLLSREAGLPLDQVDGAQARAAVLRGLTAYAARHRRPAAARSSGPALWARLLHRHRSTAP